MSRGSRSGGAPFHTPPRSTLAHRRLIHPERTEAQTRLGPALRAPAPSRSARRADGAKRVGLHRRSASTFPRQLQTDSENSGSRCCYKSWRASSRRPLVGTSCVHTQQLGATRLTCHETLPSRRSGGPRPTRTRSSGSEGAVRVTVSDRRAELGGDRKDSAAPPGPLRPRCRPSRTPTSRLPHVPEGSLLCSSTT